MNETTACCFSGHRPQKLPWGWNEADPACIQMLNRLEEAIRAEIQSGTRCFYTGMALGTDLWAAEILLRLQEEHPEIKLQLAAVLPFRGQASRYPDEWKQRHDRILEQADEVVVLHERSSRSCYMERNRYMVDRSNTLIAVYGGGAGGTKNTLEYAQRRGLQIVTISPETGEMQIQN